MELRNPLLDVYWVYLDDYLDLEKFAEHGGLTVEEAAELLALAKKVASHPRPEV